MIEAFKEEINKSLKRNTGFIMRRLISCFFLGIVALLVLEFSFYYPLYGCISGKILFKFDFDMEYLGVPIYGN
jgi:hypothetical protein